MNPILIFIITLAAVLFELSLGATGTCLATLASNGSEVALLIGGVITVGGAILMAIKLPGALRGKTPPSGPA